MHVGSALIRLLRNAGVRYLFGNPGTTELPFLDGLLDADLDYVLALQEATAVAAADGYAQASGQVGVVNLHVAPGLANGLSIVGNAARAKTPLVVTAGQQDTRLLLAEPILAGDMVRMTEGLTKWSYEVRRAEDAVVALRRALKVAQTPPTGPVFLSLPMDLVGHPTDEQEPAPPGIPARAAPDAAALGQAGERLVHARAPLIIAGDGVARAGAVDELVALAELLGAPVHGEPIYRRTSFPGDHPLWRGGLFPTVTGVRKVLETADVALIAGASAFTWFLHAPGEPFPRSVEIVQVDDDPWEVGKSYPVALGIVGDVRAALGQLRAAVDARLSAAQRTAAAERAAGIGRARGEYVRRVRAAADAEADRVPISPAYLMQTLAPLLPDDVAIVDESASSLPLVLRYLPFKRPGDFFGSKTGTLGWAMGAAVGVQLARPGKKVVVTIGDGSVMYTPQALWTAAHRRLPITYVVANNASYAILKSGMLSLGLASAKRGEFPGMDLVDPEVDYVGLARALGVRALRVDKPGDLRDALADGLQHPGPALVDVAIDRGFKAFA